MRIDRYKKVIAGAAFAFVVLFSAGMISAQAQDRDRDRRADQTERRDSTRSRDRATSRENNARTWDNGRNGNWERDRAARERAERDRIARQQWEREHSRVYVQPRVYTYPRTYGNYGGYGSYGGYGGYGGGYNSGEQQRGYRDGLDRGQEDARSRRSPNPNNSSHYRSGDSAYRDGFRRGYEVGYRQYAGYRRF